VPVVAWPGFDDSFRPRSQHNANAAFIVEAVNAHDRLARMADAGAELLAVLPQMLPWTLDVADAVHNYEEASRAQ